MMKFPNAGRPVYRILLILACLAFGLGLAAFAYTGTFARYWADDYCYNAVLRSDGFWKAQASFYTNISDRFSVIPLVGLSELFGEKAIRFWPAAAIVLALASLVWALKQAAVTFGWKLSFWERLLLAAAVTFFTFWQAPSLFQVLYWRTGMLTYFLPLVADVFLAGLLLQFSRADGGRWWQLLLVFLVAFFAGGFSETTTALQGIGLALAFGSAVLWQSRRKARRPAGLDLLGAAIAGTLVATVVLILSPSAGARMTQMKGPAPLPVLFRDSFRYGLDFIKDTVLTQPLPTAVSLLVPFALGLAWRAPDEDTRPDARRKLVGLLVIAAGMYLLIVAVCLPSVYVEVAYPEYRALIAARFAMVLGLAAAGWLAGGIARDAARKLRIPPGYTGAAAALALAVLCLYPLRSARTVLVQDLPYYQARAAGWDERDRQIHAFIQQGQTRVQVEALDSIAGLMDLNPNGDSWPNNCVAGMYGLSDISGIIPEQINCCVEISP